MANFSLSGEELSIESIKNWYDDHDQAIKDFKNKVVEAIVNSKPTVDLFKFKAFTVDDVDKYFSDSKQELENLVCFNLISATEAKLRVDYTIRVKEKDKSGIGRIFRDFHKRKGKRISLEEHIIEVWKKETGEKIFGDFLGILNFRHWLAHGRYWNAKLGRKYTIENTYGISKAVFDIINTHSLNR